MFYLSCFSIKKKLDKNMVITYTQIHMVITQAAKKQHYKTIG